MSTVTINDVKKAVRDLGIKEGDVVLVHSSLKSMGYVEGGADAVIDGFLEVLGKEGTLVFPTLCQKDWEHVYENWNIDAPSDVGYITNVFRKRQGALRSNQATHSVAAIGAHAAYITQTHGETGKRYGTFGDTPFAEDSPWEKMYMLHGQVIFLGVSTIYNTFRHLIEYRVVDAYLNKIKASPRYEEMKLRVASYGRKNDNAIWPYINYEKLESELERQGLIKKSICGDAEFLCLPVWEMVNIAEKFLKAQDEDWVNPDALLWMREIDEVVRHGSY